MSNTQNIFMVYLTFLLFVNICISIINIYRQIKVRKKYKQIKKVVKRPTYKTDKNNYLSINAKNLSKEEVLELLERSLKKNN